MLERLQKVLANAGVASRRACEELIAQGRVSVNGQIVSELGAKVDPETARLKVDGERVRPQPRVYLMLHKPRGVLSTARPETKGERLAVDFAPERLGRVYPVGRLDKDSEGLLLLTNDGALSQRLTHPRHEAPKVYRVTTRGRVGAEAVRQLKGGVWLSDGKAQVAGVRVLQSKKSEGGALEITLKEGKNRQIRRMLAKVGLKVKRLCRVKMGPITLSGLKPGEIRPLHPDELRRLFEAVKLPVPAPAPAGRAPRRR